MRITDSEKRAKLRNISRTLCAPCLTVEALLDGGRDRAMQALLDLVVADDDCQSVLRNWNANREIVSDLYQFLLGAGAGQSISGLYAPCLAVSNPWTLEYLLASRSVRRLNTTAACAVLDFLASGGKNREVLLQPHSVEVALTCGPGGDGLYRPYSITAMHKHDASAPQCGSASRPGRDGRTQERGEFKEPESEHAAFAALAYKNEIVIGVEPALARRFFMDQSTDAVAEQIKESVRIERLVVRTSFWLMWVALLTSFLAAVKAFAWLSTAVIPASFLVYWFYYGRASMGKQRLYGIATLLTAVAFWSFSGRGDTRISLWLALFTAALFLARLTFVLACFLLRCIVIRNEAAYDLLAGTVIFPKEI